MNMQQHILAALREQCERWEGRLASLSEAQIAAPLLPSHWSTKDVMAQLWARQQRTIARVGAALHGSEPAFPQWPPELDPEAHDVTRINAWIYETHREQPWSSVHREWRAGYLRLLELAEAISEQDLLDGSRYPWLSGHPLALYLLASYDHHQGHLEGLLAWLREHGNSTSAG
jgi:hypothetical protein